MDKSPSHNIFDEASKKRLDLPLKKTLPAQPEVITEQSKSPDFLNELDTQMLFDSVKELQQNLDKKRDELKNTIESTPEQVIQYFNDSKNFTPEQWNTIQSNRSDLEKNVWAVIGKDPKKVREEQISDKNDKLRKGKSLGARHNWIPMR